MKTVKLFGKLTYDDEIMHGDDQESIEWFTKNILFGEDLILHSNEIGDSIGTIKITKVDWTINE